MGFSFVDVVPSPKDQLKSVASADKFM
jgi:hypothetical protein